jgi:hypothetical protein
MDVVVFTGMPMDVVVSTGTPMDVVASTGGGPIQRRTDAPDDKDPSSCAQRSEVAGSPRAASPRTSLRAGRWEAAHGATTSPALASIFARTFVSVSDLTLTRSTSTNPVSMRVSGPFFMMRENLHCCCSAILRTLHSLHFAPVFSTHER